MTTCIITIKDTPKGELSLEGTIDGYVQGDPLPAPTAALIVASYLAAHAQQIAEAAGQWFIRDVPKENIEADSEGGEVEGAPV